MQPLTSMLSSSSMPLGETILRLAAIIRLTLSRSSLRAQGAAACPAAGAKAAIDNVVPRKRLRFICVIYDSRNARVSCDRFGGASNVLSEFAHHEIRTTPSAPPLPGSSVTLFAPFSTNEEPPPPPP